MTAYPRSERRARKKAAAKKRQDERKFNVWSGESTVSGRIVFVAGYVLPSLANARLHWRSLATIKARQRDLGARMARMMHANGCVDTSITITLTRVGVRLLDDDNLAAAFKHIRDGIAAELGVDDGPTGPVAWRYDQRTGKTPGIDARWSKRGAA